MCHAALLVSVKKRKVKACQHEAEADGIASGGVLGALKVSHAATELADSPEAEAAGEQLEDSEPDEPNGPPADQGSAQPADPSADQEATEAIATPFECGQLLTRSSPTDGHHSGNSSWECQSSVQNMQHNVGSTMKHVDNFLWPLC